MLGKGETKLYDGHVNASESLGLGVTPDFAVLGEPIAVYSFDHARTDARCFDLAFAFFYSCCVWGGTADGELNLEKTQLFLTAYQQTWRNREGATVGFYPL